MGVYARKHVVYLRLSDNEHAGVEAAAKKQYRPLTDWVRSVVMSAAIAESGDANKPKPNEAHAAPGSGGVKSKLRPRPKKKKQKRKKLATSKRNDRRSKPRTKRPQKRRDRVK